jgi:hypothetical protein
MEASCSNQLDSLALLHLVLQLDVLLEQLKDSLKVLKGTACLVLLMQLMECH